MATKMETRWEVHCVNKQLYKNGTGDFGMSMSYPGDQKQKAFDYAEWASEHFSNVLFKVVKVERKEK